MTSSRPHIGVIVTLAEAGGAQTFVASLLPALLERYDVFVAAHGRSGPVVDACGELGVPYEHLEQLRRDISPSHDALATLEVMSLLRRMRPDLIQINSSKAGIVARAAARLVGGVRTVFTAHGWVFSHGERTRDVYAVAERAAGSVTDAIVCVSRHDLRLAEERNIGRPSRRHVIHNGVDVLPSVAPPRSGPLRVISVGRLQEQKDHVTVVAAAAEAARLGVDLRVDIVGDGPDRAVVEQAIAQHGASAHVRLLGLRGDVPALLRASDVFVLSSRWEGLPYSILEAMATGLPVVASAVGGVPELVVGGETGHLVPAQDVRALRDALTDIAARPDRGRAMGEAGRDLARRRFSIERMQARYMALFDHLLSRGVPDASDPGGSRAALQTSGG